MGVLTDLIVADQAQAEEIGRTHSRKPFAAASVKGFDQIKGATLWCILNGEDTTDINHVVGLSARFELLYTAGDDGPWVYRFPDEFIQLLTEMENDGFDELAAEWAKTEEFKDYPLDDVRFYLETLYDTAASAEADGKSILMWICL
jgi:hypothetical protein